MPRISSCNFSPKETGWVVLHISPTGKVRYAIPGHGPCFYANNPQSWKDYSYAYLPDEIQFAYKFDTLANAKRFARIADYPDVAYYCPEMLVTGNK